MRILRTLGACALAAAGLVTSSFGQVQVAGTLQVDVDATGSPVGALDYLPNSGAMGGVFAATNNAASGVTPQIIALGGNGTHGVLLDGNAVSLRHFTDATRAAVMLPPTQLTGANPMFSVEVWMYKATINDETGPVSWGTRTTGQNVSCNWGRNTGWGGFSWQGGGYDYGWATVPTAGAWHHLAWTYDGAGNLRLYKDGVLDSAATQTAVLNVNPNYNILIGLQHNNSQTAFFGHAAGVLGKVRIHDGVLDATQVASNYAFEAAAFTNGTPAAALITPPLHRYAFNLPATNNAIGLTVPDTGTGGATNGPAVIQGTKLAAAAIPSFDGTQVILPAYGGANNAGTNAYVDMPNYMISPLASANGGPGQLSLELWVNVTATAQWAELVYLGNCSNGEITGPGTLSGGGANGIVIPAQIDQNAEQSGFRSTGVGNWTVGARLIGSRKHIVVTWDEASNLVKIYHEGIQVGQFVVTGKMTTITDVNNWLGRSGWNDRNCPANYREFRIYDRVLSAAEVRHEYLVGPYDVVDATMLTWNGNVNGDWNTSTYNWLAGATSTNFTDGSAVQFGDNATGTTTLNLATTLSPKSMLSVNSSKNYTFGGTGKISGSGGLTKEGSGTLTITGAQANDYTGPNVFAGGKVIVSSLANGGSPSAIGASTADPINLSFSGGALSYQGAPTVINRGYFAATLTSTLEVQNSLTLSGTASAAVNSGFVKSGPGTLAYTTTGSNLLSGGAFPGYTIARGTVVFDGTAGGQTNRSMSEFFVGGTPDYGANLIISNATLISDSWLSIGRRNGAIGNVSTMTLENGNAVISANGLSMGNRDGLANLSSQVLTLKGASTIYMPGFLHVGESTGSSASTTLSGTSWIRDTRTLLGLAAGSTGALYIANSAAITNASGGYTSIGTGAGSASGVGGVGTMVVKDNGAYYSTGDFNVSDLTYSMGQCDIMNNAVVTTGAGYIGKAVNCVGVLNISGGSLTAPGANFQIGQYGQGTVNQSGGVFTVGGWPSIGRYAAGVGSLNVSGGTFAQTNTTTDLMVPEEGTAMLIVSGNGLVSLAGRLRMGNGGTAPNGTVNLDGGTIVTRRVWTAVPAGFSAFYFNGGVLQAAAGADSDFMSGLSIAYVAPGGARIDSAGNDITIAQDLMDNGGGLTKLGAGTLTLSGYLYYTGPTVVSQGTLATSTRSSGTGNITVADGAELSVAVKDAGASINPANLTVGTTAAATLTVSLGNALGNPTTAPINVTATLTLNGPTTVNIDPSSSLNAVGIVPLVSYVGPKAGTGSFVLGTLPPGVFATLTDNGTGLVFLNVTSIKLPRWEGLAGGTWDIQVTTNWIDQPTLLPDYFYQGTRALFDDQALGTTSVSLVTNVAPGGVMVSNNTLSYAISGVGRISGSAGLTKLGTNSLTLSTTNNNYTGPTFIDEGGTLVTTVANNLGTNSALVISNASVLSLGANSQKFKSVTLANGTIAASGATVTAPSLNLDNGSVGAVLAGGTLTTFGTNTDLVTVLGTNTYTGPTVLGGSTLAVPTLANGGLASGVGASSANPTNLVFNGGGLSYTGPAATIDRGYSVANGGTFSVSSALTLLGQVSAAAGTFNKGGPATLTYARTGTNTLTAGNYQIGQGTVLFDGGASTPANYLQTNRINGELWVGYDQVNAGALILTNTSLAVSSWIAIDRGNGTVGSASRMTLYDSLVTAANCSMGYNGGIAGNSSFPVVTLLGNSALTVNARTFMGESPGADARIVVAGTSRWTQNSEWFALGSSGRATMVLSNYARATFPGDFNLGDVAGGDGTLNIYDNATNLAATVYVGKGNDAGPATGVVNQYGGYMGRSSGGGDWRIGGNSSILTAGSVGTYNLYGGLLEPAGNLQIGAWGTGSLNQSGGIANCASYPGVGRFAGSVGTMTVSGGVFNQTGTGQLLIIGEEGTGTLTIAATGTVTSAGGISIGHTATGIGTVNLDGGRLVTTRVFQNGGAGASSTINLNGGVLTANANNADFMSGLGAANVLARGAIIDTTNYSITIAQPLLDGTGGGGLTKLGTGVLTLSGANTYTGLTVVSNGALVVNGSIAGPANVKAGGGLGGNGTVIGTLTVEAGGGVSAGAGIGALTLNASPVLNGIVLAEVNRNGGSPLADLITVTGNPITYTGTLVVTNTGSNLVVGDTFKLFQATGYSGGFTLLSQTPGQIVTWNTANLTVNGTIAVATAVPALPSTPTNIVGVVVGGNLDLSWPPDYTGWILQGQTNAINIGLSNNWATVPGSSTTNHVVIPIDKANGSSFFRLVHP
jgi:fibronectin-binding autotransporter adhesin